MSTEDLYSQREKLDPAKLGLLEKRLQRARDQRAEARASAPPTITRRLDQGPAQLSFAQQRLWFIDQLEPGSSMYVQPNAVRLTGWVDLPALEATISEIIRRHEIFRTVFINNDGHPAQVVMPHEPLKLVPLDLSGRDQSDREMLVQHLINEEGARPFDLMRGPVIRVSLYKLDEEDHIAIFTMHHIAADGWSIGVLVKEIVTLYTAYLAGKPSPIPELPIQYADFAVWQREWLQGDVLEKNLDYWRQQLRGVPAMLELPTDRPRSSLMTHRGARHFMNFPDDLARSAKELSRNEGVTLFMTMLAAWQLLLARYSQQTDIVVGTTVANRNRSETENLIGFFVNTLVMRADLSGDPSFSELLQRVKEMALGAYAHQDLPFEKLVEELQPERSMNHTPLFQVMFGMENTAEKELNLPGLKLSPVHQKNETTIFDLSVGIFERNNQMTGLLEYSTDLFESGTIERMDRHYKMLLEAVVRDPTQPISNLSLLTSAERHQVLVDWNRTATPYPRDLSIHELFEQQAERDPEAVALIFGEQQVTYGDLNARANRLAHYLRDLGVGPEVLVGLMVERRVEMVVGLLGILKSGGAYLPLDPLYPMERLAFMIEDAQVPVLLTQERLLDNLPSHWGSVVCLDTEGDLISDQSDENPGNVVTPDNLAYVMYTSGSTGKPKGICVSHRNVVRVVKETNYAQLDSSQVLLQIAPISFDASTFEIWGSLLNGARLVVFPPERPSLEELASTLQRHQITILWITTGLFHQMVERQLKGLRDVKLVVTGGDVMLPSVAEKALLELTETRVNNMYGPTEATTFTTFYPMDDVTQVGSNVSIGWPIANTEVYVLDEMLRPVGIGLPGELCIGGDGLARGYLGRADLTAERFVPHPFSSEGSARLYRTGDIVRYLDDGRIEFMGRADGQVKVRGFRVELGEIEAAMCEHPDISAAVVVARREADGDKQLVGYVVNANGEALAASVLREWMRGRVPDYMIPNIFVPLDKLPLTANGKLDRKALPDPSQARAEELHTYVAPRTVVEEVLCGVWAEVLKLEQIGVHDNFFDLGGHSLLATQLISHVREALGVELPLMKLFEQPTVAGFATNVEVELSKATGLSAPPVLPAPRDEPLPLSFAQQRLWFIDQMEPMSPAYNIPAAMRMTGRLNFEVTQQTFDEVVRRHESLRTAFPSADGLPVQVVHEPAPFEIPITDLSELPENEREPRVRQLVRAEARRPFDLTAGPLLRVSLLRLGPEDHVALFTMHHIVSDGWSIGILVREVAALYGAFARGDESPLPELAVQYGDYAVWQREWLQGEVLERQLGYWKERLAGAPAALELPTDRPRPAVMTQRGASHGFTLSGELSRSLQELGRREGVTLFMVLLAAFDILLMRYTGREDVVVGTPIAGRNRAEVEGLIGFFVNTLVMRTDLNGDPSFRELLERVKVGALGAYAHQDLPFEKLVEELQPERSLSHTPLFQVMLVLQNAPMGELELPGLKLSPVGGEGGPGGGRAGGEAAAAKFELTLALHESREGLRGSVSYNRDLFEAGTIERMSRHFTMLLEGVVRDATQRISSLPLLTSAEQQEVLVEWNRTATTYPREFCIPELFSAQAERHPEAVAVVDDKQQWSYGELDRRSNQLAHHLRNLGIVAEARVAILLERSCDFVLAALAVLKAGGAYVPLDPKHPADRTLFMLRDSRAAVLVTEEHFANGVERTEARMILLDQHGAEIGAEAASPLPLEVGADNLAYLIYTSGSTGQPKAVAVTHSGVMNLVRWHQETYAVDEAQRASQVAGQSFDASVWEIWPYLTAGASLHIVPPEVVGTPRLLVSWLVEKEISMSFLPTPLAEAALAESWPATGALKYLLTGGDRLHALARESWPFALVNHYGPTENSVVATSWIVAPERVREVAPPIGRPIANTAVYVLDVMLQPLPVGVGGELYLSGAGLARGYWQQAELTAERFLPNPFSERGGERMYQTGDLARYLAGGELEFLGRADGQVKVRGYRVELGEVEAALQAYPGVREAVVAARAESGGEKRLVAYVVSADGAAVSGTQLREWLGQQVPDYMVPSVFVALESLPLTANGKVDRQALPDPSQGRPEERAYVGPRTAVEEALCGIWAEVLKLEQVGVHDNFFELGGHSLLATQLMSRVRNSFSVELPLRSLFQQPTVAGLSLSIEAALLGDQELVPAVVPVSRAEALPLSFAQQRLWFIDQLQPLSAAYNVPTAVRLTGQLNLGVTQRTFDEIVRRHEALRTTFPSVDGQPVQEVQEAVAVEIPLTDLSELEAGEREQRMRQMVMAEARRPFDLTVGPMLRVSLLRLGPEDHVALFTMHHIVSDGWSMGILVREVAALYGAYASGEESPLAELAVQYGDYAAWQRGWLQGGVLERQLSYWKERLAGVPAALELLTDRPRPAVMTQRGATHGFTLSGELSRSLQELGRREGVTLFMVLLAAFDILLLRYTGREDVVVGTPIAGRNRAEVEELIGFFVNTLVMRTDLSGDPSFRELLERVKETALGAYAHQDLPFEKLVEELQPERSLSHTPLFQVMLALQNAPMGELELPGLKLSPVGGEGGPGGGGPGGGRAGGEGAAAKFELTLTLVESREGLRCILNYNRDLFEEATIERLGQHLTKLLEEVVVKVAAPISRLEVLSEAERRQQLVEWNKTRVAYASEPGITELFEEVAARVPEAVAVESGAEELTYGELNARANQLAHYLRRQGVGAEEMVGVYLERSTELLVALLGIMKAGGAYVPLERLYPAERLSFILEETAARVVLTQQSLMKELPPSAGQLVCLEQEWEQIAAESRENPVKEGSREGLVYVLYTSGSTGQPKGVCVTQGGLVNYVRWARGEYVGEGAGEGAGAPVHSSLGFDLTVTSLYLPLLTGQRVVLLPEEPGIEGLSEALRQRGDLSLVKITPAHLQLLSEQASAAEVQGWTRTLVIGGDALFAEQLSFWRMHAPQVRLINEYGPTETVVGCASYEVTPQTGSSGAIPIGRPIANTEMYLLDGHLQPLPLGAVGQLYIGGAGLARGYLRRPELTAERFIPHPYATEPGARLYQTGDLGRYLAGGELEFLGRADGQVKVRGYRVELGEVEAALQAYPGVREAVVAARAESGGEKRLVAYVVSADGAAVSGTQLREWLGQQVPDYMVPSVFVALESLPLTANGKVDRQALPDPSQGRPEERAYVGPRTGVEEALCGIWAEVLKLEQVGVHDNFFELGGHSLLATQLMSRVRNSFSVELPLRSLFQQPTVAGLSLSIEAALLGDQELVPAVVPVSRAEALPLSFAQQRLWFIDQLQPLSAAYNVPTAVRLTGQLNLGVTQRTFDEIVRRHEALRTTFPSVDGQPVQEVQEAVAVEIPLTDLSELEAGEREQRMRQMVMAEARRPFDLTVGPMLRVSLLRLGPEDHVALFTMHHIVSDGWSMGILVREVAALYGAYASGEESPLAELAVQYGDYAAWQRGWLQGGVLERQLSYWKERLAGVPAALELLTDRPRPAVMTQRGATHGFTLSGELSRSLQELGRREGVTLFMVLLAAFDILLLRYTGREDVVVGTPIAGRNRAEVEELIGFFVNTLVMRTDLSGDPSFRELLERVKETALGAYAHQDLPFEKLVEELQPERSLSHTPLFQVMLALQNAPMGELELPGLKLSPVGGEGGPGGGGPGGGRAGGEGAAAKFELTLTLVESREGLRCILNYNRDLFDEATIERLGQHLTKLLEEVVVKVAAPISRLEVLSEAERRQQLVEWNKTQVAYASEPGITELFEEVAARVPEAVAVESGAEELTYGELNARANQLAHYLRRQGVGAEEMVGVYLERSTELLVALLGIMKAGGAYVPLERLYPAERLSFILEETAARVVLTQQSLMKELPPSAGQLVCLEQEWEQIAAESRENPVKEGSREGLVYVLYTSGSTGQPKGVCVTQGGLVNYVRWARGEYVGEGAGEGAGAPVHSSLGFDLTVTSLYLPLLTGQRVVLLPEEPGLEGLSEALRQRGDLSLVKITPAHLQLLSEQASAAEVQGWTRTLVIGGDALFAEQLSFWRMHAPQVRLINEYGPTETVVGCASYEVTPQSSSSGAIPIGRPIANTELYLLDGHLQPLPLGAVGQLYIGGAGLARGYLRRPELTAERFIPHPYATEPGARLYQTGDLGRYLAGGELEFLGRADGQVKVRGYRVELGEVEAALQAYPGVREAVVAARAESGGEKRLVAYVVSADGVAVSGTQLREWLGQQVPDYMVPSVFVALESLPLTANGKVDRQALPDPEPGGSGRTSQFVAPRDVVELQLAKIWEEVLGVESVGARDDFFDLGGHSMIATRMMYRIAQVFGRKIPLAALFESPTIEHLAELLRDQAETHFSSLVQIQAGKDRTPLFCAHPSGGNILCYADLARHIGSDQPIYGLQSLGLDKEHAAHTSIEEMAAHYVELLRTVQPEGPYFLGGWSMGGVLAFEMAQQLMARGQEVAKLFLIDVLAPKPAGALRSLTKPLLKAWSRFGKDEALQLTVHFAQDIGLNLSNMPTWREKLEALTPDEQLAWVVQEAKLYRILPPDMGDEEVTHLFELFRTNLQARMNYAGHTYQGRVKLFIAEERFLKSTEDPTTGWAKLIPEGFDYEAIPGDHYTMMRKPNARVLAERLRLFLDEPAATK